MLKLIISLCLLGGLAGTENEVNALNPSNFIFTIMRNKVPSCMGTAIDDSSKKTTIVTAAHCVYNMQPSALEVSQGTESKPVYQVLIHPYYMPPLLDYDIALLKVKKSSSSFEKSGKSTNESLCVEISKEEPKAQSDSIFTLHWDMKEKNETSPKNISASVEDRKSCRAKLAKFLTVSNKMLCANFQSGVVPDGSPLLYKDKLAGIASYGLKGNLPKIYTNIANYEIFSFIDMYA